MNEENESRKELIDKLAKSYEGTQGGIFRNSTREKIVTKKGISGRNQPRNTFWYRQRESVKTALLDLSLFIKEAGDENVNQVITHESLRPVVNALLWQHLFHAGPDVNHAEIAQLLIEEGFAYLRGMYHPGDYRLPLSSQRTIEEAVDLSKYILSQVEDLQRATRERRETLARIKSTEATRGR